MDVESAMESSTGAAKDEEEQLLASENDEDDALMDNAEEFSDLIGSGEDLGDETILHLQEGEAEKLLADDDDDDIEHSQQVVDTAVPSNEDSDNSDKNQSYSKSHRGQGYSRGQGRFFRGGLMGRMPPPGKFLPPFGPRGFPPLRGPPFLRPPFGPHFRHPMGMRGPPRHPMMRGGPIPPGLMMRGPPIPRGFYPDGPRPPGFPGARPETPPATTSSSEKGTDSTNPTPLMSIQTPSSVKQKIDQQKQRERAQALAQRQQMHVQRNSSVGIKRSSVHLNKTLGEPATKQFHQALKRHELQQPDQPQPIQQSTITRSNLRQIQCVDHSSPQQYPQAKANNQSNQFPNLRTLTQHSTSNVQPVPTHNGNLRTIPLVGSSSDPYSASPTAFHRPTQSTKIRVSNLPANVTFNRVNQMTSCCGDVKTIQVENGYANIEFVTAESADKFIRLYNRKTFENLSVLNVSRLF